MTPLTYAIVTPDIVWLWYYDELGTKYVRELLGRDAVQFIEKVRPECPRNDSDISENSETRPAGRTDV